MLIHRYTAYILIGIAAALLPACANLNPSHLSKFTFEGKVTDTSGKPIPNAWVKVRGWETLTDANGKWRQEQVVNCGTLREHMDSFEENDAILITATGYESSEEKFIVKHPGWFQSCTPEQTVALNTTLEPENVEKKISREAAKKVPTPKESPALPLPDANKKKGNKGKFTL